MKFTHTLPLMALVLAFAACSRMSDAEQQNLKAIEQQRLEDSVRMVFVQDSIAASEAARRPASPQQALKEDAKLARTMPLSQFAKHMKARESYYRQFEEVKYEDDFVKIKMEGDELKIETKEGKAKFEDGESKIKTDTYKRKTERD